MLNTATTPTAEWEQRHASHLAPGKEFAREPFNHPDGTWYWLVCPCGAKHLTGGGG